MNNFLNSWNVVVDNGFVSISIICSLLLACSSSTPPSFTFPWWFFNIDKLNCYKGLELASSLGTSTDATFEWEHFAPPTLSNPLATSTFELQYPPTCIYFTSILLAKLLTTSSSLSSFHQISRICCFDFEEKPILIPSICQGFTTPFSNGRPQVLGIAS